MSTAFTIIIPARLASTRLPEKILQNIAGKPMIQHVYERACESHARKIIIATDDKKIADVCEKFRAEVCMTAVEHQSGTERIAEVIEKLEIPNDEIIVNVQGDEPLISPKNINQVADSLFRNKQANIATLCESIKKSEDLAKTNIVKVVRDKNNFALYFSRAIIPWDQKHFTLSSQSNADMKNYFRHIGIYAYTSAFVKQYVAWQPSPLEKIESLEQLRALWYGVKIIVEEAIEPTFIGVDCIEDLENIRKYFP